MEQTQQGLHLYRCERCSRYFSNRVQLNQHKRLHPTAGCPFVCRKCHKGFPQISQLQWHNCRRRSTREKFLCQQCGKTFLEYSQLQRHQRLYSSHDMSTCTCKDNNTACYANYLCTARSRLFSLIPSSLRQHLGRKAGGGSPNCRHSAGLEMKLPETLSSSVKKNKDADLRGVSLKRHRKHSGCSINGKVPSTNIVSENPKDHCCCCDIVTNDCVAGNINGMRKIGASCAAVLANHKCQESCVTTAQPPTLLCQEDTDKWSESGTYTEDSEPPDITGTNSMNMSSPSDSDQSPRSQRHNKGVVKQANQNSETMTWGQPAESHVQVSPVTSMDEGIGQCDIECDESKLHDLEPNKTVLDIDIFGERSMEEIKRESSPSPPVLHRAESSDSQQEGTSGKHWFQKSGSQELECPQLSVMKQLDHSCEADGVDVGTSGLDFFTTGLKGRKKHRNSTKSSPSSEKESDYGADEPSECLPALSNPATICVTAEADSTKSDERSSLDSLESEVPQIDNIHSECEDMQGVNIADTTMGKGGRISISPPLLEPVDGEEVAAAENGDRDLQVEVAEVDMMDQATSVSPPMPPVRTLPAPKHDFLDEFARFISTHFEPQKNKSVDEEDVLDVEDAKISSALVAGCSGVSGGTEVKKRASAGPSQKRDFPAKKKRGRRHSSHHPKCTETSPVNNHWHKHRRMSIGAMPVDTGCGQTIASPFLETVQQDLDCIEENGDEKYNLRRNRKVTVHNLDFLCDCCERAKPRAKVNTKRFATQHYQVEMLRQKVCRLFRVLFPKMEYPGNFHEHTSSVEEMISQVIDIIKDKDQEEGHNPEPGALMDVRVVLCKHPRQCLHHLRRKVCRLLRTMLPDLQLKEDFNKKGDEVEQLLDQVIASNSSS